MHRKTPVCEQVYKQIYQLPLRDKDPQSWQDFVRRCLVPEMRLEVQIFYGPHADALMPEARFPGLDYTLPYHRLRLRRYPHHRRLFAALDALRLTEQEIYTLCDWEGTLIVRRRYEQQNHIRLRDTTGDEIVQRAEREAQRWRAVGGLRPSVGSQREEAGKLEEGEDEEGHEVLEEEEEEMEEDAPGSLSGYAMTPSMINSGAIGEEGATFRASVGRLPGAVQQVPQTSSTGASQRLANPSATYNRAGTPVARVAA